MKCQSVLFALGASAVLSACTTDNPAFQEPEATCAAGENYVRQPFNLADPTLVDILFVVDDSAGMADYQAALGASMSGFVSALNEQEGLDWQIAVTSTDLRDAGALQTGVAGLDNCPGDRPTIIDADTPEAARVASCNVQLGEDGNTVGEGLATARQAIEANDEIGRDGASIVVVFFSRRDDCSATSTFDRSNADNCFTNPGGLVAVGDYVSYFAGQATGLAGNPVSIVTIGGPTGSSAGTAACDALAPAFSADRYSAVATSALLSRHSFTESICRTNFDNVLAEAVATAVARADDGLCAAATLSGAPEVVVVRQDENDPNALELDAFGEYIVEGPTDACPTGVVAVSTEAHADADGHRVEVWYCTADSF